MSEWRTIDSAPKDGTRLLLCRFGYRPGIGRWFSLQDRADWGSVPNYGITGWWISGDPEDFHSDIDLYNAVIEKSYQPTHWQPLPEPPRSDE